MRGRMVHVRQNEMPASCIEALMRQTPFRGMLTEVAPHAAVRWRER